MTSHDLYLLHEHRRHLLAIANSLEAIARRNPDLTLCSLVASELHDRRADLAEVVSQSSKTPVPAN